MILPVVATACTFIVPHLVWFVKLDCCDVSHFLAVSSAVWILGLGHLWLPVMFPRKSFFAFDTLYYTHSIMECQVLSLWSVPHFGTFLYLTHYRVFVYLPALFCAVDPIIHSIFDFGNFHCCVLCHILAVRSRHYIYGKTP